MTGTAKVLAIVACVCGIALLSLAIPDTYATSVDDSKTWDVRWIARNNVGFCVGLIVVLLHVAWRVVRSKRHG